MSDSALQILIIFTMYCHYTIIRSWMKPAYTPVSAVCAPAALAALIRYAALLFVEVAALGTPSVEISKAKFRVLMTAAASNTSTGFMLFRCLAHVCSTLYTAWQKS